MVDIPSFNLPYEKESISVHLAKVSLVIYFFFSTLFVSSFILAEEMRYLSLLEISKKLILLFQEESLRIP